MDRRLELQQLLETLTAHVYFQPPDNLTIHYPCIVYQRDNAETQFADNSPYRHTRRYQVTYIDRDPDSVVYDSIAALPLCTYERFFRVEGLNHDVFTLFF